MLTFEIKAFSNADRNMLRCERQTAGCVSDTTTRALQSPGLCKLRGSTLVLRLRKRWNSFEERKSTHVDCKITARCPSSREMVLSMPMCSPRSAVSLRSMSQLAGCRCSATDGNSSPKGCQLTRQQDQRLTSVPSLLGVPSLLSDRHACNFSHRQHRRHLHCSAATIMAASNGATAPTQRLPISRGDFFGGLTSAVVALPLALAFGQASGEHKPSHP